MRERERERGRVILVDNLVQVVLAQEVNVCEAHKAHRVQGLGEGGCATSTFHRIDRRFLLWTLAENKVECGDHHRLEHLPSRWLVSLKKKKY